MIITCDKAATISNKTQYEEASYMDSLKLKFHNIMCTTCPSFIKKNNTLTTLCEKANLHSLSEQEKLVMKDQLLKKIQLR